jgi:hypothetical protein
VCSLSWAAVAVHCVRLWWIGSVRWMFQDKTGDSPAGISEKGHSC